MQTSSKITFNGRLRFIGNDTHKQSTNVKPAIVDSLTSTVLMSEAEVLAAMSATGCGCVLAVLSAHAAAGPAADSTAMAPPMLANRLRR